MQTVLVVDFGAQYAQLIARRVREVGVYSEIVPHTITAAEIAERKPAGIILSGGPASVHEDGSPRLDQAIYELGIPMLAICYGFQLVAHDLGGQVERSDIAEFGPAQLSIGYTSRLLKDMVNVQPVWMSHQDSVTRVPLGFERIASTPGARVAAYECAKRNLYGVQYHPEVSHTRWGMEVFRNFLLDICGCEPTYKLTSWIGDTIAEIREQVGDQPVICGLSGGVDSAIAATLVHQAVGDQLTCVYVDTGLMRAGETEQIVDTFQRHMGVRVIVGDEGPRFLQKLRGVGEANKKRTIIGETFWSVFWEHALRTGQTRFLVQGTLYPDVVESGGGANALIKPHHNLVPRPAGVTFELIEPLRTLFKDEVRTIGTELGVPDEIVWRQPFPGPGLAIRIEGVITRAKLAMIRQADLIFREEIEKAYPNHDIWQYFPILTRSKAVAVVGDSRLHGAVIALRAVTSEDAMTADWARLDYDVVATVSSRIMNEVPGVARVALDVTSKPPGTIEWE